MFPSAAKAFVVLTATSNAISFMVRLEHVQCVSSSNLFRSLLRRATQTIVVESLLSKVVCTGCSMAATRSTGHVLLGFDLCEGLGIESNFSGADRTYVRSICDL